MAKGLRFLFEQIDKLERRELIGDFEIGSASWNTKNLLYEHKKGFVGDRWWGAWCENSKNIWCGQGLTPLTGCKSLANWCTRLMHTNYLG
jgi:hypothetical protein